MLFFLSLFDSILMIASRQTTVFKLHNALIFTIIAFCVLTRMPDSLPLYEPFLVVLRLTFLAELLFFALSLLTYLLVCSNHDGCANATIYYKISIVTRLLLTATLYRLTEYAWLAYKQYQTAQKIAAEQHRVAVDARIAFSTAFAFAFAAPAGRCWLAAAGCTRPC